METGLVDRYGRPLKSAIQNKKADPPPLGERYGQWAGEQAGINVLTLPGGGAISFNTSTLTLADFRAMKSHYQINSSLSVLTFMMHQMDWHIECDNKKIADHVDTNMRQVWSRLVRAKSQALWAGYSPNALQWENNVNDRTIELTKIKDLLPEDCRVHWKKITNPTPGVPGSRSSFSVYDGIDQWGSTTPIPVECSYWYPLLMENGNYYGRRLLESAFQPWFFSMLMHLFANRYYERFGEPTPVGRAPYEDEIDVNGRSVRGNDLMAMIIQQLRSRSTVILPNDKTPVGDETNPSYDYTLEYLESQMRGADFERYMTRLDEEMSLAMFTPILMMRTADVGSYNLGTQHTQVYQWMLNAISGDWADYINKYILRPMVAFNFGIKAPAARIKFVKQGRVDNETLRTMIQAIIQNGTVKPDLTELGELAGMSFKEVQQVTNTPEPPPAEEPVPPGSNQIETIVNLIVQRVRAQVIKGFRNKTFGDPDEFSVKMGYQKQLTAALQAERFDNAAQRIADVYEIMDKTLEVLNSLGPVEFDIPDAYMNYFETTLRNAVKMVTQQ